MKRSNENSYENKSKANDLNKNDFIKRIINHEREFDAKSQDFSILKKSLLNSLVIISM